MILITYRLLSLLILGILLSGCERKSFIAQSVFDSDQKVRQQADLKAEEYAIYSLIINSMYSGNGEKSVVVFNQTTTYALPYSSLDEALINVRERTVGDITTEVFEDFLNKNKLPAVLTDEFSVGVQCVLLGKEDLNSIFQVGNGWIDFNSRYPGQALLEFSRVGFNPEMIDALVYTSSRGGPKTGQGNYVTLTKTNGGWTIRQKIEAWTS